MYKTFSKTGGPGPRKYTPKLVEVEMIFKISRVELHHNMLKRISVEAMLILVTSPHVCQTENSNSFIITQSTSCIIHKS